MIKHLTREQIDRYRAGTLLPLEEDALEAHLDACAGCRDAVQEAVRHVDAALAQKFVLSASEAAMAAACPDRDLLRRYAEGGMDAPDREIALAHVEGCSRCAAELASLRATFPTRALSHPPPRLPRRPRPGFPAATLKAVAIVVALMTAGYAYGYGQNLVRQFALIRQVSEKIQDVLGGAQPALEASHYIMSSDPERFGVFTRPDEKNRQARANLLLRLLRMTPEFNRLYYADQWGDYTAAEWRSEGEPRIDLRRAIQDPARGTMTYERGVYPVNARTGEIDWARGESEDSHEYDPRRRPWYTASRAKKARGWNLYRFHDSRHIGVTASLPLSGPGGEVVGVFGIDLALTDLRQKELAGYVADLERLSADARVLILSDRGQVIARISSENEDLPAEGTEEKPLELAVRSGDPVVRAVGERLTRGFEEEFDAADSHVAARRIAVKGLPWTVAVAVPNRDIRQAALPRVSRP